MATYYIEPYTKYHQAIKENLSTMISNFNTLKNNMKIVASQVKSIKTYGTMADWDGLGYEYLTNSTFDAMQNSANTLADNLNKPLTKIVKKCNNLNTRLGQLKSIDETLDKYKEELALEQSKLSYAETEKERKNIETKIKNKQKSVDDYIKKAEEKLVEVDSVVAELNGVTLEVSSDSNTGSYLNTTFEEETMTYLEEYLVEAKLLTEEELAQYKKVENPYSREISLPYGRIIKVFQQRRLDSLEYVEDKNGRKWSFADHGCGPTSAAIIISSVEPDVSPIDVYIAMDRPTSGTGGSDLVKAFNEYSLECTEKIGISSHTSDGIKYNKDYNVAHFMKELKKGNLIAVATAGKNSGAPDSEFSANKGHWVVVYGVTIDEETGKEQLLIADPAGDGTKHVEPFDAELFFDDYAVSYISVDINSYEQDNIAQNEI